MTDKLLGEGSEGKIYKGYDTTSKTYCAVKVSPKYDEDYLFKEYSMMKNLNHQSVVKVYDYLES